MIIKIGVVIINKLTDFDLTLFGGSFLWNFGPLILMIGAGAGSDILKEKYKEE